MFLHVINGAHWSVYFINLLHRQIDILDSISWVVRENMDDHRVKVYERIRSSIIHKGTFSMGFAYLVVDKGNKLSTDLSGCAWTTDAPLSDPWA